MAVSAVFAASAVKKEDVIRCQSFAWPCHRPDVVGTPNSSFHARKPEPRKCL
jgi:hypothetical protein